MAAARLEDASLVLLAFGYLTGVLALVTGLAPVFVDGLDVAWKVFAALGGALAACVLFVTLKYASEALRAVADMARTTSRLEARLERALASEARASAEATEDSALTPKDGPP